MPSADLARSITHDRIEAWVAKFRGYRSAPTRVRITNWLKRFEHADQPTAAQILDRTVVLSESVIQHGYRMALDTLPGWSLVEAQREGRWFFVGWGGAGESGPAMLHSFREANSLEKGKYNSLFRTPAEIPGLQLTTEDNLVFVDDFAGTGSQVCTYWPEMQMLIGEHPRLFLILAALTEQAQVRLEAEVPLELRYRFRLGEKRNVFSDTSPFSTAKQATILSYCKRADRRNPKGYGECGLLLVLAKKTPNNTIPILHSNHGAWRGLFPRHLAGSP